MFNIITKFVQHHYCHFHRYQDCHETDLKLRIASTKGEVRDSHKGCQKRLYADDDDDDNDGDEGDDDGDQHDDDEEDLDIVLERVGDQGLTEEGGHTRQHSSS